MIYDDFKFKPTPKWKVLAAKMFGEKVVGTDEITGATVTSYLWRGHQYIINATVTFST